MTTRRTTMQRPLPPMEVSSVDGPTSMDVNTRDQEWLGLIGRAFGRAGISHKAAAADMEIDAGLLSAQLSGVPGKHLSWRRLGKLPPAFWRELLALACEFHTIAIGQSLQDRADMELGRELRALVGKAIAR